MIEDYLLKILLECMTEQEMSLKNLDKRLKGLEELVLMNNRLLGFIVETLSPAPLRTQSFDSNLNEDLLSELIKHSAELETWGKS
tara:strand:- start:3236 stop:3490 length:255 start_codon:yes stop_codon:yes gene_type:complete